MPIITELIQLFAHTVKYFAAIKKIAIAANALILKCHVFMWKVQLNFQKII